MPAAGAVQVFAERATTVCGLPSGSYAGELPPKVPPLALQVTFAFEDPLTLEVKAKVYPVVMYYPVGVGALTVTVATGAVRL